MEKLSILSLNNINCIRIFTPTLQLKYSETLTVTTDMLSCISVSLSHVFFLLCACPSWIRAVSFPVLQLRTSPSVVCPPCHLHWPCGRRRLRWSSWRKESQAWASVSWTTRSETCLRAFLQIAQTVIDCSLRISMVAWTG